MNAKWKWAVGILAVVCLGQPAEAQTRTAEQVADELQRIYEQTADFKAAFRQEYQSRALGQKKISSGFVYVKKPGLMRWDYREPRPKHFVSDGKALYIYDPDLEQVMVDRSFSGSDLSTAVTFLWGKGKLREEFAISFGKDADKDPAHYLLELLPRSKTQFKKLWFKIERKSFRVVETVVEDPGGNINRIQFSKLGVNVGLADEAFRFQVPDGVDLIEAPGSK
jgi:outer membrane lipoprotein carrier protein